MTKSTVNVVTYYHKSNTKPIDKCEPAPDVRGGKQVHLPRAASEGGAKLLRWYTRYILKTLKSNSRKRSANVKFLLRLKNIVDPG